MVTLTNHTVLNFSVKFELKSGKRLTRPLGHVLTLSSLSKTSRDYE